MSSLPNPLPTPEPSPGVHPGVPEPPRPKPRRWLLAVIGLGVAAAGILSWQALASKNTTPPPTAVVVKTAPVAKGDFEVRVRVTGSTTARSFINIIAPKLQGPDSESAMVLLRLGESGRNYKPGDPVAEFDSQNLRDHIDDTAAGLRDRQNDVKKKVIDQALDMENLHQSLRVAKASLDKVRLDAKATEIRTEVDKELLRLAVEEAEAAYKEIEQELQHKVAAQTADMRITQINLKLQQDHLGRHANDVGKFVVKTPMAGMFVIQSQHRHGGDQVYYAVGDRINPGTTFGRVIDQSSMQIEGIINQAESSLFRVGQEAIIRLDAYPGRTYKGRVYSIGALAAATGRSQYYVRGIPIRIQIESPDKLVIPDLSGSAEILLDREAGALMVPLSAVATEGGKSFVQVRKGQALEKREVILGQSNGIQTTIRAGVNEGESVVVN